MNVAQLIKTLKQGRVDLDKAKSETETLQQANLELLRRLEGLKVQVEDSHRSYEQRIQHMQARLGRLEEEIDSARPSESLKQWPRRVLPTDTLGRGEPVTADELAGGKNGD